MIAINYAARFLPLVSPMAFYQVEFVDHGNNVYSTQQVEHDSDDNALRAAHFLNVPSIGAGFDLWEGERLVHRHRNPARR